MASAPFLLLTTRAQPAILRSEIDVFHRYTGLDDTHLVWHPLDQRPLTGYRLDDWAGIILCGSPYDSLTPQQEKSDTQRRVEDELGSLVDEVIARDFPFLGVCYAVAAVLGHLGGTITTRYGEEISAPRITVTDAGAVDPITAGMPREFHAYVGHKEACEVMPEGATLLATSDTCPVQLFSLRTNIYGTQFHPELDEDAIMLRIREYSASGYYPPAEQQRILDQCRGIDVEPAHRILANFVTRYGR